MQATTLPACQDCGSTRGWVVTMPCPVYVSVTSDGKVDRVRVNDEALDWRDTTVTCRDCDAFAPPEVSAMIVRSADNDDDWPAWQFGS